MTNLKGIISRVQLKSIIPYFAAISIFLIMTLAYVNPVLEGRRLQQPDIVNWMGMSKEIADFREETGEEPLWTNSMFGGMPSFQITAKWANNIASFFHSVITLGLPSPADKIFIYFLGFFFFLLMLKVNPWIAMAGAIGFALSSYHFIIIEAGHNTKAFAIGYMAPVLGSIIYTFRGNYLGGGILFAIFMGLQLFANHFQITYYLGLIVAIYGLVKLYEHYNNKQLLEFLKKFGVLFAGLILAIGINIGNFWGTYTYASETMRGGTELTIGEGTVTSGLSKEYITNWSYGIDETLTLLIPNAKGGATGPLGVHERALERADPAYRSILKQENSYWGDQPFTSGPVYVGAVVLFFFFLGLFYLKGSLKWSLLAAIVLAIVLSWGKNMMPFTSFFIEYVPGYNKFRAVSMTLVIVELCIPVLAFLGLCKFYKNPEGLTIKSKSLLTALGLTSGLSLLFYLFPSSFFSFLSQAESESLRGLAAQQPTMAEQIREFIYNLEAVRISIFRADAIRSFFFAALAGVVTLLFARNKLGKPLFIILVVLLITIDMWPVNRRYLNDGDFVSRRVAARPFELRQADQYILQDEDTFRVLDLTVSTFNSSHTSYFHHSIGGYHGAKLQRYQELIDFHIIKEMTSIAKDLQLNREAFSAWEELAANSVMNMLNTRYIIYHPQSNPIRNPFAAGNAWFVNNYKLVEDADAEIMALHDLDIRETAIIDKRFKKYVQGRSFANDPGGSISLVSYKPNHLIYNYNSQSEQLAVFSEIYYPDGWVVKINGKEADHFRVNYILRGMVLPPGNYEISFSFRPAPYYTGRWIALFFSSVLVLSIGGFAFYSLKNRSIISDLKK